MQPCWRCRPEGGVHFKCKKRRVHHSSCMCVSVAHTTARLPTLQPECSTRRTSSCPNLSGGMLKPPWAAP